MGAHLIDGEFQSDKYPTTPRGKVPLSVKDPMAQDLLWMYAQRRRAVDAEFSDDLEQALRAAGFMPKDICGVILPSQNPEVVSNVHCGKPAAYRHRSIDVYVCADCSRSWSAADLTAVDGSQAHPSTAVTDKFSCGVISTLSSNPSRLYCGKPAAYYYRIGGFHICADCAHAFSVEGLTAIGGSGP